MPAEKDKKEGTHRGRVTIVLSVPVQMHIIMRKEEKEEKGIWRVDYKEWKRGKGEREGGKGEREGGKGEREGGKGEREGGKGERGREGGERRKRG